MAAQKSTSFEVEGIRFELRRLSVDDACEGVDILSAEEGMRKFARLLKLFSPVCKVSRSSDGTFEGAETMVPLKLFANDVFEDRLELLVGFMGKAIDFEFGRFLATARARVDAAAADPTETNED